MTEIKPTMLTYIEESPEQIGRNADNRKELTASLVEKYLHGDYQSVWIIACGSSSNASMCARPFMMKYLGLDVKVISPATFLYQSLAPKPTDFCFVISQSGCSTNSIQALDRLGESNMDRIGITGNITSDFKDHTDLLIDYGVGTERVGYVTKGVTTLTEFLMLFALEAAHQKGQLDDAGYKEVIDELQLMPQYHRVMQQNAKAFYQKHIKAVTSMQICHFCGFEQSYGVALEAALKTGETLKIPSFAYEAEEYIHGPNLQLTPNYTVFVVDDYSAGHNRLTTVWQAVHTVTDKAFMLTNDPKVDDDHACRQPADKLHEPLLAPLFQLPFFQYISYAATEELKRWEQHPLMKEFKKIAESKTPGISKVMDD